MPAQRFPIRRDPLWRPILVFPFAATTDRSYVEIDNGYLTFRFGFLFHRRFPIADVMSAQARSWSFLGGIGWRSNFFGLIGLIGSLNGVIEVQFRNKTWVWMGLPMPCNRVCVSLEDPDTFLLSLDVARDLNG